MFHIRTHALVYVRFVICYYMFIKVNYRLRGRVEPDGSYDTFMCIGHESCTRDNRITLSTLVILIESRTPTYVSEHA